MSPQAIDRRLREVAQLHQLGVSILGAKRLGKLRELETGRADTLQPEPTAASSSTQDATRDRPASS